MIPRLYFSAFLLFVLAAATFAQEKINIGILDLQGRGVSETEAMSLTSRISNELFLTGRFTIVERDRIDAVLAEQGIQQSGCTSSECIIQLGQILNVQLMIAGSADRLGRLYTIHLRMIDVASGKIMAVASADREGTIEEVALRSSGEVVKYLMNEYDRGNGKIDVSYKPKKIKPKTTREYSGKKWRFGVFLGINNSGVGMEGSDIINNSLNPVEKDIVDTKIDGCWGISVLRRLSNSFYLELQMVYIIRRDAFEGWYQDMTTFNGEIRTRHAEIPILARWEFLKYRNLNLYACFGFGLLWSGDDYYEYWLLEPGASSEERVSGEFIDSQQKIVQVFGCGLAYSIGKLTFSISIRYSTGPHRSYKMNGQYVPVGYQDFAKGNIDFSTTCFIIGIYL